MKHCFEIPNFILPKNGLDDNLDIDSLPNPKFGYPKLFLISSRDTECIVHREINLLKTSISLFLLAVRQVKQEFLWKLKCCFDIAQLPFKYTIYLNIFTLQILQWRNFWVHERFFVYAVQFFSLGRSWSDNVFQRFGNRRFFNIEQTW